MKIKFDNTNYKSKKTVIFLSVIVIVAAIIFISFSYFTPNITEENNYTTSGGTSGGIPSITYTDLSSGINLTGTYPMVDEEGLTQEPYNFRVTNNESEKIILEVYLQTESGNTVPNNLISESLNGSSPRVLSAFPTKTPDSGYSYNYKIDSVLINASSSKDFSLRVWFNEEGTIATVQNKNWYGKIFVKARFADDLGTDKIMNLVAGSPTNTTNVITKTAPSGASCTNTLAYDGTTDNNLRYVGADPCNYVTFNEEEAGWRIIGIMNNIDDGTGNTESRIKLIRATKLGSYSWDTSANNTNSGNGINDWTQADLMTELNGDYLDTNLGANTNWYNGKGDQQTGVFDYTKRLSAGAQELIGDAKWYLGGFNVNYLAERIPSTMYVNERGPTVYSGIPTEWTGKVALMYPSDYGYATAGGTTTNRSSCIGTLSTYNNSSGETWRNSSYSDCKNNDWLKPSSGFNWLLSHIYSYAGYALIVSYTSTVGNDMTYNSYAVLPAVYLKSNVSITGGTGTSTDPYTLG